MARTYGVWDSAEGYWLGDESGPKLFSGADPRPDTGEMVGDDLAYALALVAAQVAAETVGWPPGRAVAREYDGSATRVHDEVAKVKTTLQALADIERGKV